MYTHNAWFFSKRSRQRNQAAIEIFDKLRRSLSAHSTKLSESVDLKFERTDFCRIREPRAVKRLSTEKI